MYYSIRINIRFFFRGWLNPPPPAIYRNAIDDGLYGLRQIDRRVQIVYRQDMTMLIGHCTLHTSVGNLVTQRHRTKVYRTYFFGRYGAASSTFYTIIRVVMKILRIYNVTGLDIGYWVSNINYLLELNHLKSRQTPINYYNNIILISVSRHSVILSILLSFARARACRVDW